MLLSISLLIQRNIFRIFQFLIYNFYSGMKMYLSSIALSCYNGDYRFGPERDKRRQEEKGGDLTVK